MKLSNKLYVIEKMTHLIDWEITGNSVEFAEKLGISRSQLFIELDELKCLDVDITYSRSKKSFVFSGDKKIKFREPILVVARDVLATYNGGSKVKFDSVHFSGRNTFNLANENSLFDGLRSSSK